MNSLMRSLCAVAAACSLASAVQAQDRGSREEAKALVNAAVAHVKEVGADKAFDDFTKDKATWTKKDLYIVAHDISGSVKAHGANEKMVGKNIINLKDPTGKELVKECTAVAVNSGEGWCDYQWIHPQTKKMDDKSSFIKRVPGTDFLVLVGVYR